MPILMRTPDMIADTWLGAMAWALGSQTCSGMMPAFRPKPTRARMKIAVAMPGRQAASGASGASANEPLAARSRANRANRHRVATWVATR